MHFVNKGKGPKGGTYLKCSSAIKGKDCCKTAWRYSEFEASFLFFVKELDLRWVIGAKKKASRRELFANRLSGLHLDLEAAVSERERHYNRLMADSETKPSAFVMEKFNQFDDRVAKLEREIELSRINAFETKLA